MLHATIIMEDTILTVTRDAYVQDRPTSDFWRGTVADNQTGKSSPIQMTDGEMAAVSFLMLCMDSETVPTTEEAIEAIYRIAEQVMSRIPKECRLIP